MGIEGKLGHVFLCCLLDSQFNIVWHPDQVDGEGIGALTLIRPFDDRIGRLRHIEGVPDAANIEQHLLVKMHDIRTMEIAIAHDIGLERVACKLCIGKHCEMFFAWVIHPHPVIDTLL
jgi:hypothetical protein